MIPILGSQSFADLLARNISPATMAPITDYRCADCPTQVSVSPIEHRSLELIDQVGRLLCTACWRAQQPKQVRFT